jgi:CRP-like cAMP-binding protein
VAPLRRACVPRLGWHLTPDLRYPRASVVFAQGGPANSVFYIQHGGVQLSVLSRRGREAIVAMLAPGAFFGEGCLAGQLLRIGTATALVPTTVLRIQKRAMRRTLHEQSALSDRFIAHMVARNVRIEVNSSLLSIVLHD